MKDIFSRIKDYLMPETMEEVPVREEAKTAQRTATTAIPVQTEYVKQGNGADIAISDSTTAEGSFAGTRPNLKVIKHPDMNVLVFTPTNFNDTRYIADALKNKKIIVINFEKVETSEQIRVSDFMNGACYVLDGSVKQITKKMSLYVPKGINIEFETTKQQ